MASQFSDLNPIETEKECVPQFFSKLIMGIMGKDLPWQKEGCKNY